MSASEYERFLMPPPPPRASKKMREEEKAVDMLLMLTNAASQVGGDAPQPARRAAEPLDIESTNVFRGVSELFW